MAECQQLEHEDTVVVQQLVHLAHEGTIPPDTNVLRRLETDDLGEVTGTTRNLAIVHAEDTGLVRSDTVVLDAVIIKLCLVLAKGDASDVATVVFRSKCGKSAPSTPDVKQTVIGLKAEFRTDHTEFVVLELFESLSFCQGGNDTRCVDHARTEEPTCVSSEDDKDEVD